jgi:hypothetical protein
MYVCVRASRDVFFDEENMMTAIIIMMMMMRCQFEFSDDV